MGVNAKNTFVLLCTFIHSETHVILSHKQPAAHTVCIDPRVHTRERPPHPVILLLYLATVQLHWSSWGVDSGSRTPQQWMREECVSHSLSQPRFFPDTLCSQTGAPLVASLLLTVSVLLQLGVLVLVRGSISIHFVAVERDPINCYSQILRKRGIALLNFFLTAHKIVTSIQENKTTASVFDYSQTISPPFALDMHIPLFVFSLADATSVS